MMLIPRKIGGYIAETWMTGIILKQKITRFAGLLLFNVVIVVVFLEVGLRLFTPILPEQLATVARRVSTGQPYAQDWTPAWQTNADHYWILKPGIENELQYGSPTTPFRLTTIELWAGGGVGFRTRPVDFFVDAVVVGDSFGMCFTEQADCWVEQLATHFQPPLGIVNLSQPVTGTTSHGRILADFGAPLTPPLVIWQFFGNDFNDDYGLAVLRDEVPEITEQPISQADAPLIEWLRRNSVAYAVIETVFTGQFKGVSDYDKLFIKPHTVKIGDDILQFGAGYEQQAMDMFREQNQIGLRYSREAFQKAQDLVETWAGQLVVVIIPTREEVYAQLTEPIMGEESLAKLTSARDAMHDLCDELDMLCYDPLEDFTQRAQAGEMLYFADDMHLNPHGNAVLAKLLAAWLKEQKTLD
jgi:lysophospholipase L1-like esterase